MTSEYDQIEPTPAPQGEFLPEPETAPEAPAEQRAAELAGALASPEPHGTTTVGDTAATSEVAQWDQEPRQMTAVLDDDGQPMPNPYYDPAAEMGGAHPYAFDRYGADSPAQVFIKWQEGPIGEVGVNGVQIEDVIDVLVARLEGFQAGEFACEENAEALMYLRAAKRQLEQRTERRRAQGVEGRNLPHES